MKKLCVLGSAGNLGSQTLEVVAAFKKRFNVVALAERTASKILAQAKQFKPRAVCVFDLEAAEQNDTERTAIAELKAQGAEVVGGLDGLNYVASLDDIDTVVNCICGAISLHPTLAAIRAGKDIIVPNKEALVCGGEIVMREVKRHGVRYLPMDSEHVAIHQCLRTGKRREVKRLLLTCSGGALREAKTREELASVTPEQVLRHPTWRMGSKITIDSATLMNKGLELIEAHWLFDMPYEQIDILGHPQSIIHSAVEFKDGSIIAQLATHDMRLAALYALTYPKRLPCPFPTLDLVKVGRLDFRELNYELFPAPLYAREAGARGGTLPAAMNAANEVAVYAFLDRKIRFLDIMDIVRRIMGEHLIIDAPSLEDILAADAAARRRAEELVEEKAAAAQATQAT